MKNHNKIESLLYKAVTDKLSDDEKVEFETFIKENPKYHKIYMSLSDEKSLAKQYAFYDKLDLKNALRENSKKRKTRKKGRYILATLTAVAAIVVVLLLILTPSKNLNSENSIAINEVPKSESYVKLIINDHEVLPIADSAKTIQYENRPDSDKIENLKVVVGVGPVFKFNLPDGTICYMNNNSEIEYPATFTGDSRRVTMKGELFLDVVSDKDQPFVVQCGSYSVRVLGTRLNIKDYHDDLGSFVTLIEGKVEIEKNKKIYKIKPNQQAIIGKDSVAITSVDATDYTMWINNRFAFQLSELQDMVNTLKRWYNVDIQINDESLKNRKFTGVIPKYKNIDSVLNVLEETTDIKFIKGSNGIIRIVKTSNQ